MLQPSPYPTHYPPLHKLNVLEKQARALGQEQNFYRVPQTTFFHDGLNAAGVEMKASTGSGQDCTGVNDGSKNSVLMNYIPDAWNWGAEIFCECEVRYIRRDEEKGGYVVFFAWHGDDRNKFGGQFYSDLMWVRAVSGDPMVVLLSTTDALPERALLPRCRLLGNDRDSAPIEVAGPEDVEDGGPKDVWEWRHVEFW